jgi:hypothetical protein
MKLHISLNPDVCTAIRHEAKLAFQDERLDLDAYDLLDLVLERPPVVDLTQRVFAELFDLPRSLNLLVNHNFLQSKGSDYRAVVPSLVE